MALQGIREIWELPSATSNHMVIERLVQLRNASSYDGESSLLLPLRPLPSFSKNLVLYEVVDLESDRLRV